MSEGRSPGRTPTVDDDEILAVLSSAVDPVLTTAEVAAAIPIGERATLERLKDLRDRGDIESKQVGARGLVWWRTGDDGPGADLTDDPFLTGPTYASGRRDVSEAVDEVLVEAADDESGSER